MKAMVYRLLIVGLVIGLLVAACAPKPAPAPAPAPTPAPKRAIKIGLLHALTGPLAGLGAFYNGGAEVAFEGVGYQVAGRKIEVIKEDTEGKPDVGLTKVRKLVERDKVDIIIGPISSAVALAIGDYVAQSNVTLIISQATVEALTREKGAPNIFRVAPTDPQTHWGMPKYIYDKLGYKKLIVVALDYVAGQNHVKAFEKGYTEAGGTLVEKVFIPLGTADPAPFITKVLARAKDADAVHAILWGADAARFAKQQAAFGLREKIPLLGFGSFTSDGLILPVAGKEIEGLTNYYDYAAGWDNPVNKRFVEAFFKKMGKNPSSHASLGHAAAVAAIEALKAIEGNIEDRQAFLRALKKVDVLTPRGRLRFDDKNQAIITRFIRKVEPVGDTLMNVPTEIIEDVRAP
ncbi:MAG: ABC transporter substrate-binding protein [Dehalococcoidia bacterium]